MAQLVLSVNPSSTPVPWGPLVLASYIISQGSAIVVETKFDPDTPTLALTSGSETVATDPLEVVERIGAAAEIAGDSSKSATFLALAKTLSGKLTFAEVNTAVDSLDDHLAYRTFLVGHSVTAADAAVWGALRGSLQVIGILKKNAHRHLQRWYSFFESLPSTISIIASLNEAKSAKKPVTTAASSFALGLNNAVDGQVVTRFPPEPSGYLHIGHAKAALLNEYFAKMYHGKLIIRFDDTNPSKEKSEFEQSIIEDLELMGIKGDIVTHTSDNFQFLYDSCITMLKTGKAYADDTEQEKMQKERMDGIASERRDSTVEENLARFAEMTNATEEGQRWCIRAKLSVDDPNKALRDPVIYRCNQLPHHRTGDKWKVYPTYDFACPLIDCLEGVTHALRTNEYRDRLPQYKWMLQALNLRDVEVWDFSRVNFVYTLLSKRKLHWFVENKLVSGWDDPRFPTVRGIRRRGLTIDALKTFMLSQGPSQSQMTLEWDGIWATNKKVIDPVIPRFWAIAKDKRVPITIKGGPAQVEVKELPKHKKNPETGLKKTAYSSNIFVEQEDAASFEENEEITLMDWGNAIIRKKTLGPTGEVTALEADLFLEGDFKKTKKKVTWLASDGPSPLVDVTLLDYDYLITKDKLEKTDDVTDYITPTTEFRVEAIADANVAELKRGDIIQFERKGYYILDRVQGSTAGKDLHLDFISIPDGRTASVASKAVPSPAGAATPAGSEKKPATVGGWGKGANAKAPAAATPTKNPNDKVLLSEGTSGFEVPVTTSMYTVDRVVGGAEAKADTTMYKTDSIYQPPSK